MEEIHEVILSAVKQNQKLIEKLRDKVGEDIDLCNKDMLRLRYYVYGLGIVVLILLGKPEWITALL